MASDADLYPPRTTGDEMMMNGLIADTGLGDC